MILGRRALLAAAAAACAAAAAGRGHAATAGVTRPDAPGGATPPAGWGGATRGGAGGRRIVVATLAPDGPGSLRAALEARGPRHIEFAVEGVIDLGRGTLRIDEPFVTLDGGSAPGAGITLLRGGLRIGAHDVVVRHLRIRPGEAGAQKRGGWECDGLCVYGHHVLVDHCSLTWATDENLSASGPRFEGVDATAWRAATAHAVTFSHNLVAEGLSNSTHAKGEHSKGSLIHDNVGEVLLHGNLYAHNRQRNALFKGGARGVFANNLVYNPGSRTIHYNLHAAEWQGRPFEAGALAVVGNVVRGGPDTEDDVATFMWGGDGPLDLYLRDNLGRRADGRELPPTRGYRRGGPEPRACDAPPLWPAGFAPWPAAEVEARVLAGCGARPWARDAIDRRIVDGVRSGGGRIIDSEQEVGGYAMAGVA